MLILYTEEDGISTLVSHPKVGAHPKMVSFGTKVQDVIDNHNASADVDVK